MTEMARLLSPATNYAIVQLPGRRFPGIVFQGDSTRNLLAQVDVIRKLAGQYNDDELDAGIAMIQELLQGALNHYETVCAREGIGLPYVK